MTQPTSEPDFQFGRVTLIGFCCGKPVGCTMCPPGCLYKHHLYKHYPWKRTHVFGDTDAPCCAEESVHPIMTEAEAVAFYTSHKICWCDGTPHESDHPKDNGSR